MLAGRVSGAWAVWGVLTDCDCAASCEAAAEEALEEGEGLLWLGHRAYRGARYGMHVEIAMDVCYVMSRMCILPANRVFASAHAPCPPKVGKEKKKKCACSLFYVTIVRFTVIDDHALFFFPSFLVHSRFIARHKTQNV